MGGWQDGAEGPERDGEGFRAPASYGGGDQAGADPDATVAAAAEELYGQQGGAPHPKAVDVAEGTAEPDAEGRTVLLGDRGPAGGSHTARRPGAPSPIPRGARPARPAARPQGGTPDGGVDKTLVSPAMQGHIAAERRAEAQGAPEWQGRPQGRPGDGRRDGQTRLVRHRPTRQVPRGQQGWPEEGDGRQPPYRGQPTRRPAPQAGRPAMAPRGYAVDAREDEGRGRMAPGRDGTGALRAVLLLVSWALRLMAWALVLLVVVDCFTMGNRLTVMRVTARVAALLPSRLAGVYVIDTPFGGAFRGDFAIAAVVLLLLDWIVARVRRSVR